LQCFFMWFFYDFFQNYLCRFFFNIKLVKNYNYNKAKSYEESVVVFLTKHRGLLQYFSKWFFSLFYWEKRYSFPHKTLSIAAIFFLMGFFPSKIIFVGFLKKYYVGREFSFVIFFFFLLTEKLNHVAKTLYLSSQNTVDCYKSFCSVSKFFITNTIFFSIMKYLLHLTFNLYYLSSAGS
jgi:hypothetical protein